MRRWAFLLCACVLTPAGAQTLPRSFFALHCEPQTASTLMFRTLAQIVQEAEKRKILLTFCFTAQWADLIVSNPGMLSSVRAWAARGHEVGGHHHDVQHPFWDGYTDADPRSVPKPGYRGTMTDCLRSISRIATSGRILTGALDDSTWEWPYGLPYRLSGGRQVGNAKSRPFMEVVNEYPVWRIDHAFLASMSMARALMTLHRGASAADVVGVVTHPFNFRSNPAPILAWFDYLASRDPTGSRNVTPATVLNGQPRPFAAERKSISVRRREVVRFTLNLQGLLAGHAYLLLGSFSGTSPGTVLGGPYHPKTQLGINVDAFTFAALLLVNTSLFQNFAGTLPAAGPVTAQLDTGGPLPPALAGQSVAFVAVALNGGAFTLTTDPVVIALTP